MTLIIHKEEKNKEVSENFIFNSIIKFIENNPNIKKDQITRLRKLNKKNTGLQTRIQDKLENIKKSNVIINKRNIDFREVNSREINQLLLDLG